MNTPIQCPFARSDMTPCVIKDGELARADDGVCVGCERPIPTFASVAERRRYVQQVTPRTADPEHPTATEGGK